MTNPEVTVMMTVYNAAKYLKEAINSILNQSFANFELLIINDGSTDESLEIITDFTDDRIRLINNNSNKGLFYSRQLGLSSAKAPLLAILDADDVACRERLALQVSLMQRRPDIAVCSGRALYINERGESIGESETFAPNANARMLFGNVLVNSAVMFRTAWARDIGGYRPFDPAEDFDLGLRLALKHPIFCMDELLVKYRIHSSNTSFNSLEKLKLAISGILADLHRQIGTTDPDSSIRAHLNYFFRDSRVPIDDFYKLFADLKKGTSKTESINQKQLSEEIFMRWAEAVLLCGGRRSIILLFNRKLLCGKMLTAKMIRRAFKRSVKSLFK